MRRRIRASAVATVAVALAALVTAVLSLSAGAGAAPAASPYTLTANGGFISFSGLGQIGLTGGGSTASASTTTVSSTGTGLCAIVADSATTCPSGTDGTSSSSDVADTSAAATANGNSATQSNGPTCLVPSISEAGVTPSPACGTASAALDSLGNATANGEGSLAQLSVSLGALPGVTGLSAQPLCAGTNSSSSSSSGSSGSSAPAAVSGLLGSVNTLLASKSLPTLSSSPSDPLNSVCSVLSGLTSELGSLGGALSDVSASTNFLTVKLGDSTSSVTHSTSASGDSLQTATATTTGVDLDILGLLDVQVLPNSAAITVDTTSGQVQQPSATTGVLSVTPAGSAPTGISVPDLSGVITNLLNTLGVSALIDPTLTTVAESSTTLAPDQKSGSAEAADLKLDLLGGLVVLNLGDAKVTAGSPAATTAVATAAAPVTPPAIAAPAAPAAVPGVTTVHTGEFWAGSLPIVLVSAMALSGLILIARRRLFGAARSIIPIARHTASRPAGGPPPGPASGTSSVPPPVPGPARWQSRFRSH
jgi:trimeric autotransporter adhesin